MRSIEVLQTFPEAQLIIRSVITVFIFLSIFKSADQIAIIDPLLLFCGVSIALVAGVLSGLIPAIMVRSINIISMLDHL